ncbi:hypothetical protein ACFLZX_04485 [Nanoarchaeota archaeon]
MTRTKYTKMKIIGLLLVILLSFSIVHGYVRTDYWECTSLGEQSQGDYWGVVPTDNPAFTSQGACKSTCCKICVSRYTYHDCWSGSAQPPCSCSASNPFDSVPPEITIHSPQDGEVINDDAVLINASTDEMVSFLKRMTTGQPLRTLCYNCQGNSYLLRSLRDGIYELTITAADLSNNQAEKTIDFTIDTKQPVIFSSKPYNGGFVRRSGTEFVVTYTENNLQGTKLFIRKKGTTSFTPHSFSCESGEEKTCTQVIGLTNYNENDVLEYYFELSDATTSTDSDIYEISINTQLANEPFNILSPHEGVSYPDRKIELRVLAYFMASEILYSDDGGDRWIRVCDDCNEIEKSVSYRDGENNIMVKVIDEGGEEYIQSVDFKIDSKEPKIKKTEPKDKSHSYGFFSVEYDEDDLYDMFLYYRGPGESEFNKQALSGCPSGKKQKCNITLNMDNYNGDMIEYYFEAEDSINSGKQRRNVNTTIDTVDPVLDLNKPESGKIFNVSSTLVDIDLDAEVESLEMYDNDGKAKRLCRKCSEYSKNLRFKDGKHDLRFVATDKAGNTDETSVVIYVDTRMPKVSSINPRDYTNGVIQVKYTELNFENIKLYVKRSSEEDFTQIPVTEACNSGTNKLCNIEGNLASYHGELIDYYVVIGDILGNLASSKVNDEVEVDTVVPVATINEPSGTTYDRYVPFDIEVNEEVKYIQITDNGGRPSNLCGGCDSVSKTKSFSSGSHAVSISIIDFAGNSVTQTTNFVVN